MGSTRQFLLFGFYCCCLLFSSEAQPATDGNQVITPEASRAVVDKRTLDELRKNFGQKWTKETALGDRQVPEDKLAVSDGEVRIVGRPGMADFVENGQLSTGKLNRRWARSARREGAGTRDSGFSRDRGEDQHSRERQVDDDTFKRKVEELAKNLKGRIDHRLLNLSDLFPIKNGHQEIGLPGQPVKKIFDFIMEQLKPKPAQKEDHNLVKKVLDNVKGAVGIGIHRAVKVGPLSLNFDVGKP